MRDFCKIKRIMREYNEQKLCLQNKYTYIRGKIYYGEKDQENEEMEKNESKNQKSKKKRRQKNGDLR